MRLFFGPENSSLGDLPEDFIQGGLGAEHS